MEWDMNGQNSKNFVVKTYHSEDMVNLNGLIELRHLELLTSTKNCKN